MVGSRLWIWVCSLTFNKCVPLCRARSSIDAFESLGYTLLYGYNPFENLAIYKALRAWIPIVIMQSNELEVCVFSGIPRPLSRDNLDQAEKFIIIDDKEELQRLSDLHELNIQVDSVDQHGDPIQYGWRDMNFEVERGTHPECIKRKGFEEGIPLAKTLAFHFWSTPGHQVRARP